MSPKSKAPARKRQRTVDDSSEEDEASDIVNAAIDEEEEDDDDDDDDDDNAEVDDEELPELEDDEEEDDDEADDDDDEEDVSENENEPEEEEPEIEDEDQGVVEADDDEVSLDEDSEQLEDEFDAGSLGAAEPARRMTTRQRNRQLGTTANIGVVDLDDISGSNRAKKKALSAEEQRIKRAELARRRRNLSQQRLEEEKQDTLDKLLKKRAGKVRGETDEQGEPVNRALRSKLHAPHPAFLSWRSSRDAFTLSMTEERAKRENLA